jgi:hypothetical protein
MSRLIAVLTCVTACALPSATSSAAVPVQPYYEFTVSFVGSGSYSVTENGGSGGGTLTVHSTFKWQTAIQHVLIPTRASTPLAANQYPAYGLGQDASGDWTITNTGSQGEDCSNSGTLGLPPGPLGISGGNAKVHRTPPGVASGVVFNLVALSGFATKSGGGDGALPCYPMDFWHDWVINFSGVGTKHADANTPDATPLSATVTLHPSDLVHGTITKHVSIDVGEQIPSDCGSGNGTSCQQSYTWSGTVRFVKHKLGH